MTDETDWRQRLVKECMTWGQSSEDRTDVLRKLAEDAPTEELRRFLDDQVGKFDWPKRVVERVYDERTRPSAWRSWLFGASQQGFAALVGALAGFLLGVFMPWGG